MLRQTISNGMFISVAYIGWLQLLVMPSVRGGQPSLCVRRRTLPHFVTCARWSRCTAPSTPTPPHPTAARPPRSQVLLMPTIRCYKLLVLLIATAVFFTCGLLLW